MLKPGQLMITSPAFRPFSCSTALSVRRSRGGGVRGGSLGHEAKLRLLDKFIKFTNVEGSIVAKAPFSLRVCGVFFKKDNSVYTEKNFMVGNQRERFRKDELKRNRKEVPEKLRQKFSDDRAEAKERVMEADLTEEQLEELMEKKQTQRIADEEILNSLGNRLGERMSSVTTKPLQRSPIVMNIYGRANNQVVSYSIQRSVAGASGTHVFISDADTTDKIEEQMFNTLGGGGLPHPSGKISIWEPKHEQINTEEAISKLDEFSNEELNSTYKIYCPPHLLESSNYIRANFLVPTLMDKVYLEGERQANLEVDGGIMDQMTVVGLATDCGKIVPKDLWAHRIRMASQQGDIICEGTIEGDVIAETQGEGDFKARVVFGPRLKVKTVAGDILLTEECFSEVLELYTDTGHVHVRKHFGKATCLIKEEGDMFYVLGDGSLDAVVKKGDVDLRIEHMLEDSTLEVESGSIYLRIAKLQNGEPAPYRLHLVSSQQNIDERIIKSGEVTSLENGQTSFTYPGTQGENGDLPPLLTVRCHHGEIKLKEVTQSSNNPLDFDMDDEDENGA